MQEGLKISTLLQEGADGTGSGLIAFTNPLGPSALVGFCEVTPLIERFLPLLLRSRVLERTRDALGSLALLIRLIFRRPVRLLELTTLRIFRRTECHSITTADLIVLLRQFFRRLTARKSHTQEECKRHRDMTSFHEIDPSAYAYIVWNHW